MRHAIWKLTALAAVVGMGLMVVMQAQRGMIPPDAGVADGGPTEGDSASGQLAGTDAQPQAATASDSPVPPQMEPLGAEGFIDNEPVPAAAKTGRRSVPLRTPASSLASETDPFESPSAGTANSSVAQAPRRAVPLALPPLPDEGDFEKPVSEEREPFALTPIKPRNARPSPVLVMNDAEVELPGSTDLSMPVPLEAPESADELADANPEFQTTQASAPAPASRPSIGFDDEDEPPVTAGPAPRTLVPAPGDLEEASEEFDLDVPVPGAGTTGAGTRKAAAPRLNLSAIGDDDDEPPARTNTLDPFAEDPAQPSTAPPAPPEDEEMTFDAPEESIESPAAPAPRIRASEDQDEGFPSIERNAPRSNLPLGSDLPGSALPDLDADLPDNRAVPATPARGPLGRPVIGDDDDDPQPEPAATDVVREPVIERPAIPRPTIEPQPEADDAAFGAGPSAPAAAPRLTTITPPVIVNPPLSNTPATRTIVPESRAPVAIGTVAPAPRSTPRPQDDFNNNSIGLSTGPERTPVAPLPQIQATQRPHLTIDKVAPPSAVLGQPMVFQIIVRNPGPAPAQQVVVEDRIPDGLKISGSIPRAELAGNTLIWRLGTLQAGQEQRISVRAIPIAEGIVGSVATVNFAAEVQARTMVTAPKLRFDISAPPRATLGAPVVFNYRVTNVSQVDSSGVIIRNVLPAGLKHADGDDLEYEVGLLPAGQSREVQLTLTAAQQGRTVNRAVVTAEGGLSVQAEAEIEVASPSVNVRRTGPQRLFMNKPGVFTNTVSNTGTNALSAITLTETVPPGLNFVSASAGGRYDPAKRTVTWRIERLEAQQTGSVEVTLSSVSLGQQVSVVRASDGSGATGETVATTNVAGVAALSIDLGELPTLLETGEKLTSKLRVVNRGSDSATNVRIAIVVPVNLQVVSVKGPGNYRRNADQVQFDAIPRLDARNETQIEVTFQAASAGPFRVETLVQSDQMAQPLRAEEASTVVALPQ